MTGLDLLGRGQAGGEYGWLGGPLRSFAGTKQASRMPEPATAAIA